MLHKSVKLTRVQTLSLVFNFSVTQMKRTTSLLQRLNQRSQRLNHKSLPRSPSKLTVNSLSLSQSVDQETQTAEVLHAVEAVVVLLLLVAEVAVVAKVAAVKTLALTSTSTTRRLSQLLLKIVQKVFNVVLKRCFLIF